MVSLEFKGDLYLQWPNSLPDDFDKQKSLTRRQFSILAADNALRCEQDDMWSPGAIGLDSGA